jgi:hypothetical protein
MLPKQYLLVAILADMGSSVLAPTIKLRSGA